MDLEGTLGSWEVEELEGALLSGNASDAIAALEYIGKADIEEADYYGFADMVSWVLRHEDPDVRAEAAKTLGMLCADGLTVQLLALLKDRSATVRAAAAGALGSFGSEVVTAQQTSLALLLKDTDDSVIAASAIALGKACSGAADSELLGRLQSMLQSPSPLLASAACVALAESVNPEAQAPAIAGKLKSPDTCLGAVVALSKMPTEVAGAYVDEIVEYGLGQGDIRTREQALLLLGKLGKGEEKVAALLDSKDAGVRCAAALTLGQLKAKQHADTLMSMLTDEEEDLSWKPVQMGGGAPRPRPELRRPQCAAAVALGAMQAEQARAAVQGLCTDPDWEVRACAATVLGDLEMPDGLEELLEDGVYVVRAKACEALGRCEAAPSADAMVKLLQDKSPMVRGASVQALGVIGEDAASHAEAVFALVDDSSVAVRTAAILALPKLGQVSRSYAGAICSFLYDPKASIRRAAAEALGDLGEHGAAFAEEVSTCLEDPTQQVRIAAARSLGKMKEEGAAFIDELMFLEGRADPELAEVAKWACTSLSQWVPAHQRAALMWHQQVPREPDGE